MPLKFQANSHLPRPCALKIQHLIDTPPNLHIDYRVLIVADHNTVQKGEGRVRKWLGGVLYIETAELGKRWSSMATKQKPESYFESVPLENRWKLDRKLDFEHDDIQIHLGRIAASMIEWEGRVADELGLTESEVADIKEKYSGKLNLQKRAALQKWQEKFGQEANYRNLITAFLNADKGSYAEIVCAQLQPLSTDSDRPIITICDQQFSTATGSTPGKDISDQDGDVIGGSSTPGKDGSVDQCEITQTVSQSSSSDSTTDTTIGSSVASEEQEQVSQQNFQCPCGHCTLESYLVKGCLTKTPQDKRFPFLNVSGLSESNRIDLEGKLWSESKKITKKFATLQGAVEKSLDEMNVPPTKLASCVLRIAGVHSDVAPLLKEHVNELKRAESIAGIFIILNDYLSFFNYEILEHIIENLGTEADQEKLEQYQKNFQEFCKRSVFEVPPELFGQGCALTEKRRAFAMKMTRANKAVSAGRDPKLYDVIAARQKIAEILEITTSSLYLCRVDEGCVEMLFLVPRCAFNAVLKKLSTKQTILELSSHGLSVVQEQTQTHNIFTSRLSYDVEVSVPGKRLDHSDSELEPEAGDIDSFMILDDPLSAQFPKLQISDHLSIDDLKKVRTATWEARLKSVDDLKKVRTAIWEARLKWYDLGVELQVSVSSLDKIKVDNYNQPADCFTAMLRQWLQRVDPKPTWTSLVEALKSPPVDYPHLAEKIEKTYHLSIDDLKKVRTATWEARLKSVDDLKKVRTAIWEARVKWYDLGVELQVSVSSLDEIKVINYNQPRGCFTAMLKKWLQSVDPIPTWTSLVEALKSPPVNYPQLAEEIEKKYC